MLIYEDTETMCDTRRRPNRDVSPEVQDPCPQNRDLFPGLVRSADHTPYWVPQHISPNAGLMLAHRLWRRPIFKTSFV